MYVFMHIRIDCICVILYFTVVPPHRRFRWNWRDLFIWSSRPDRDDPFPRYRYGRETGLPPPIISPHVKPDPDFRDDELERIISEGRLSDARKYLEGQIQMAREMRDKKTEINYRQYERKITEAAMQPKRLKPWDDDAPNDGEDYS